MNCSKAARVKLAWIYMKLNSSSYPSQELSQLFIQKTAGRDTVQ